MRHLQFNVTTTTNSFDNNIELLLFFINLINETYYKYDERRSITSKVFNIPVKTSQEFSLGFEVRLKNKVHKKNDPQMLVNISKNK